MLQQFTTEISAYRLFEVPSFNGLEHVGLCTWFAFALLVEEKKVLLKTLDLSVIQLSESMLFTVLNGMLYNVRFKRC